MLAGPSSRGLAAAIAAIVNATTAAQPYSWWDSSCRCRQLPPLLLTLYTHLQQLELSNAAAAGAGIAAAVLFCCMLQSKAWDPAFFFSPTLASQLKTIVDWHATAIVVISKGGSSQRRQWLLYTEQQSTLYTSSLHPLASIDFLDLDTKPSLILSPILCSVARKTISSRRTIFFEQVFLLWQRIFNDGSRTSSKIHKVIDLIPHQLFFILCGFAPSFFLSFLFIGNYQV